MLLKQQFPLHLDAVHSTAMESHMKGKNKPAKAAKKTSKKKTSKRSKGY